MYDDLKYDKQSLICIVKSGSLCYWRYFKRNIYHSNEIISYVNHVNARSKWQLMYKMTARPLLIGAKDGLSIIKPPKLNFSPLTT